MKKITIFLILISSIYGESLRSKFYYDSVLNCDEVREKTVFVESEMAKIERFSKGKETFFLPVDLFFNVPKAVFDDVKYGELEERLKNLKSLEHEKCKIKDTDEYFSK
jgi:hypothetical protein